MPERQLGVVHHSTVTGKVAVCVTQPELPVRVMVEVPAGIPRYVYCGLLLLAALD